MGAYAQESAGANSNLQGLRQRAEDEAQGVEDNYVQQAQQKLTAYRGRGTAMTTASAQVTAVAGVGKGAYAALQKFRAGLSESGDAANQAGQAANQAAGAAGAANQAAGAAGAANQAAGAAGAANQQVAYAQGGVQMNPAFQGAGQGAPAAAAEEEGGGFLTSLLGDAGAEAATAAVPVVGQVLAAGALVGTLIDGLVHLFHKAKTTVKNAPDPSTLAVPSTALVQLTGFTHGKLRPTRSVSSHGGLLTSTDKFSGQEKTNAAQKDRANRARLFGSSRAIEAAVRRV